MKKFQNFASKYKHKRKHGLPNQVCDQCQKGFFFKKDLVVHLRVHSGQGLFPCTNCPNKYNTWAAMDAHHIVHQNQKFPCEKCPTFSTKTRPNLRQYQRGKHGQGWKSPCGKHFDWLLKMFRRKKQCTKCITIKEQQEKTVTKIAAKLKKDNPNSTTV